MRSLVLVASLLGCSSSPKQASTPAPQPPVEPSSPDAAATTAPTTAPAAKASLYERLGGVPAITAVVEEFVGRTTTDPRIKDRFFNTDATNLKKLLVEFVCAATGGPCKYTGRDMPSSHAGMELVDEEWDALVGHLVAALDKFKVPAAEKGELLGALGPLKPQMIVARDSLKPLAPDALKAAEQHGAGLADKEAARLLAAAVSAGARGQRSYAEQLFTRAELRVGPKPLAAIAATFRVGAPQRIDSQPKRVPDAGAQPAVAGSSEADEPEKVPAKSSLAGKLTVEGKPAPAFGVVMLWPERGGKKRTPKQRIVEQRGKQFAPQVTAVPVGSTVSFPNYDTIFHNVFSLSRTKAFDLGMYKTGESREVKLDKPGIVRLGCNIHANMSAYLVVVDAPHYVVVKDGTFTFNSLRPGKYRVQAWAESYAEPTTTTLVVAPGTNEATFDIRGAVTKVSADKFGTAR